MGTAAVELVSLAKRYGRGRWTLTGVNLRLEPGLGYAFAGNNGSGKSTLLNLIAGLVRPTAGVITGRPRTVGYVPERFSARERMTATSYLTHMGRVKGLSTAPARHAGDALLHRFSFTGGWDAELRMLSKGNAQKVALAQALLVPPDLLILDEPWTGLDGIGHDTLIEVIREAADRGGIVALSRHLGVSGPAVDAATYLLEGARIIGPVTLGTPAPGLPKNRRVTRVVIRPRTGWQPLPEPWSVGAPSGEQVVTFEVPADDCDRLLRTALERHWSVVAVQPHDSPAEDL